MKPTASSRILVLVPAYNEEASIGPLVAEIREAVPTYDILVINDGSSDWTAAVARDAGARVLDLPCNVGVGGAVQAGFRYAFDEGYDVAVRCDGDGQHVPADMHRLIEAMADSGADLVIGSRFLGDGGGYRSTRLRSLGIVCLAALLSAICRKRVTDPTSGFQVLNRPLLYFFSRAYPADYPEPESLALLRRQGYDFVEAPATFRSRRAGVSTIGSWGTLYYMLKVFLALLVDRARPVNPMLERHYVVERL